MRSAPLCGSRIRWLLAAVNDRALWALRTWLDSWPGIGHVAVRMHRQLRMWVLVLVSGVACASPATTTRDAPVVGEEPPPRFAPGGPDAEAFGASMGYPKGTP